MSELPEGFDPEYVVVTTAGQIAAYAAEAWDNGWEDAYHMARSWGHVDGWEGPWPTNPYVQHETIEVAE